MFIVAEGQGLCFVHSCIFRITKQETETVTYQQCTDLANVTGNTLTLRKEAYNHSYLPIL